MEQLHWLRTLVNHQIPSFREIWRLSLLSSLTSFDKLHESQHEISRCPDRVSCQFEDSMKLDTCCVNHPSGHFLLTQFWDASPPIGADDVWTIHGLWPDYCNGGFEAYCDDDRTHSSGEIMKLLEQAEAGNNELYGELLEFMSEHWLSWDGHDSNLWAHEWNKHGTCVSTLEPQCYDSITESTTSPYDLLDYFTHAASLYGTLDTFGTLKDAGIEPSRERTYSLSDLQEAIRESDHGLPVTFKCRNHNELNEVWYHFTVRGSLRNASDTWSANLNSKFIPTNPDGQKSNCPAYGIKYLPKASEPTNPGPTSNTSSHPKPTTNPPSASPFSGRGHLKVRILDQDKGMALHQKQGSASNSPGRVNSTQKGDDEYTGCLIRNGVWYAATSSASCAVFAAKDDVMEESTVRKAKISNQKQDLSLVLEEDEHYHLFTLSSARAPCSFVSSSSAQSQPGKNGHLSCERGLNYQSIFNAHITGTGDEKGRSKILAWSNEHQTVFYADKVPNGHEQVKIWNSEHDADGNTREIKLEVYWEAY